MAEKPAALNLKKTAAEENSDEGLLFSQALNEAMADPEIASVIADYYDLLRRKRGGQAT